MTTSTKSYILAQHTKEPSQATRKLIEEFRSKVDTLESSNNQPFVLFQDGKSEAYYIDCHILASNASDLFDYEASLDPEEQEEFKANRSLQGQVK